MSQCLDKQWTTPLSLSTRACSLKLLRWLAWLNSTSPRCQIITIIHKVSSSSCLQICSQTYRQVLKILSPSCNNWWCSFSKIRIRAWASRCLNQWIRHLCLSKIQIRCMAKAWCRPHKCWLNLSRRQGLASSRLSHTSAWTLQRAKATSTSHRRPPTRACLPMTWDST